MSKEEFLNSGYVNVGYFSPELSSENTYPEYIQENVSEAVNKILSHQTTDSVTFAFVTDIHYSSSRNHNIRTERLMRAYEELKEKAHIDKLILGGDYINDGTKAYKINNYLEFRKFIDNEKYFPVNGNHDDNSIWDLCTESDVSTNHLSSEELYDLFFNHLPEIGAEFNENAFGLYYLYNDYTQKVRYVFLDSNDIPCLVDENGKLIYTKQHLFSVSQEQIDWFLNQALCFDEDGWSIIIVSHTFSRCAENEKENIGYEKLKVVCDVIDAYQSGKDIKENYGENDFFISCNAEFSKYKRGNIIACFAGHYHADFEEYTKQGVPIIYTGSAIMYRYLVPRKDGDKSELLFDVVTIDRTAKVIYITRIGAGNDRVVQY